MNILFVILLPLILLAGATLVILIDAFVASSASKTYPLTLVVLIAAMLTAMFLWLQSGVTLYYLTSNVVGIGQQWCIKKYWSGDPAEKVHRGAKSKQIDS